MRHLAFGQRLFLLRVRNISSVYLVDMNTSSLPVATVFDYQYPCYEKQELVFTMDQSFKGRAQIAASDPLSTRSPYFE